MSATPFRLPYLDSSRGIAAVVVLLAHFQLTHMPGIANSWLWKTPFRIFFDGQAAVLYFFVLSGYVLTISFRKNVSLNGKTFFNFILQRIFRIYPAFLFTLLLSFFVLYFFYVKTQTWLDLYWQFNHDVITLFKQSLLIFRFPNDPELRFLPHDWTLSIEMAVSFLLPVFAYSAIKNPGIVLAVIYASVQFLALDPFVFDFSLGIFIAQAGEKIRTIILKLKLKPILLILAGIVISSDYLIPETMEITDKILLHHKSWGTAMLLMVILSSERIQNLLSLKLLSFTGKISYSIYLLHLIILYVITAFLPNLNTAILLVLFIALCIIFSAITYYLIEKPFIKAGKSFKKFS